jgi:hypothetical protein
MRPAISTSAAVAKQRVIARKKFSALKIPAAIFRYPHKGRVQRYGLQLTIGGDLTTLLVELSKKRFSDTRARVRARGDGAVWVAAARSSANLFRNKFESQAGTTRIPI